MVQVDTLIEEPLWEEVGLEPLAVRACAAVLDFLELPQSHEISLMGCDDGRITVLNGDFRHKSAPTNVLSWPAEELAAEVPGEYPQRPNPTDPELGDIAIAFQTCAREAQEQAKPFEHHVTHLIVHGTLHLLGYDHETDPDAALMEGLETRILAKLGIPDPY